MRKTGGLLLVFLLAFVGSVPAQEIQISAGGDDCAPILPGPVGCFGGTFTDAATTVGANNTVSQVNAGCLPVNAVPSPDVIYRFDRGVVSSSATFDIRVTPEAGFDVAIYVLGPGAAACPAGPNAVVASCVAGANAGGPGVTEVLSHATLVALPSDVYFLFVDSAVVGSQAGSYIVSMGPGVCPVELMNFSIE